jgi:membrane protein
MPSSPSVSDRVSAWLPDNLRPVIANASSHHTVTLAAGLAFFGILSIGPAAAVGFGLLRFVVSADAADSLVDLLQGAFPEQIGLGDLLEQMEDNAGQYAGIGLAVLLWPATTLASGWARALDAITEADSAGGGRGLRGRLGGLVIGIVLVTGLFMLLAAATFGTALAGGEGALLVVAVVAGAVALQFVFNVVIYRWLPARRRPVRDLWPGAVLATVAIVVVTIGLAVALLFGEGLAEQYPPSLTTPVVLGLWLYASNTALLLGAEYNHVRKPLDEEADTVSER